MSLVTGDLSSLKNMNGSFIDYLTKDESSSTKNPTKITEKTSELAAVAGTTTTETAKISTISNATKVGAVKDKSDVKGTLDSFLDNSTVKNLVGKVDPNGEVKLDTKTIKNLQTSMVSKIQSGLDSATMPLKKKSAFIRMLEKACSGGSGNRLNLDDLLLGFLLSLGLEDLMKLLECLSNPTKLIGAATNILGGLADKKLVKAGVGGLVNHGKLTTSNVKDILTSDSLSGVTGEIKGFGKSVINNVKVDSAFKKSSGSDKESFLTSLVNSAKDTDLKLAKSDSLIKITSTVNQSKTPDTTAIANQIPTTTIPLSTKLAAISKTSIGSTGGTVSTSSNKGKYTLSLSNFSLSKLTG